LSHLTTKLSGPARRESHDTKKSAAVVRVHGSARLGGVLGGAYFPAGVEPVIFSTKSP
jgi:hypothetical protein